MQITFKQAPGGLSGEALLDHLVTAIAIIWGLFQLYVAYSSFLDPVRLGATHLAFALTLVFIRYPFSSKVPPRIGAVISAIEIMLIIAAATYIHREIYGLSSRIGMFRPVDVAYGMIAVVLVIDGCRRVLGLGLTSLVLVLLAYAYFGHHIPGLAGHVPLRNSYIISHLFMSSDGIFGTPMIVAASYVMLFVLFGAFMEASGGTELLMRLAQRTLGWTRGGAAKISVLVSGLFGTISGAAVANVVTVGSLTIPMMRRTGFSATTAGGIEAASSTGGQIMPPIMGAAAFIMAAILGIPYADVALGAVFPALLFYISLMIGVDLNAKAAGIRGLPAKELPRLSEVPLLSWLLLTPIFVLIYLLLITGVSASLAGLYALIACWLAGLIVVGRDFPKRWVQAFRSGALAMLPVSVAVAAAGIIIGVLGSTGLDTKFSSLLIQATGGNLLLTLFATALAAIVLGMGMPTVGVYLILAILVAPALEDLGVVPLAAHMFIFYFGILSTITPPIAISAFAAAGLSGASPTATGFAAFRLAAAGFIIPFLFVYSPELLMTVGSALDFVGIGAALLSVTALTAALSGIWAVRLSAGEVVLLMCAALLLIIPDNTARMAATALLILVMLWQWRKSRSGNTSTMDTQESQR